MSNPPSFNNLPVRQEYLDAVLAKLPKGKEFKLAEVVSKCGLSRTQTTGALNRLVKDRKILISERDNKKFFSLVG